MRSEHIRTSATSDIDCGMSIGDPLSDWSSNWNQETGGELEQNNETQIASKS